MAGCLPEMRILAVFWILLACYYKLCVGKGAGKGSSSVSKSRTGNGVRVCKCGTWGGRGPVIGM